ncbi:universal stress protein [Pseudomonas typographi]|uniref:universal stress protein n=1 Tax=Pseudomonas typographi TaxID=2715964 RepID=UPI001686AE82|nr:universal stress protein [Pseudomonas typographi]MBD1587251.1 universal stress protein [Pseudomonas typographi]
MYEIGRLLVVLGDEHGQSLALRRARLIAKATGAHMHLLVCDRQHDRTALLAGLKAQLVDNGYSVTSEQAWEASLHETILSVQQAEGCDLVIKQRLPDGPLKLIAPEDWKLLRYCPCTVLMVKHDRFWTGGVVLAAVDIGNADTTHRALQEQIIDQAFQIAELAKGSLHLVSAHPAPTLAAIPLFQAASEVLEPYRERYQSLQAHFDIDDEALHIAQGPADALIPFVAEQLDAVVTVIGTVARDGIAGALIGNTAEAVLDTLQSDVLVLKTEAISAHLVARLQRG